MTVSDIVLSVNGRDAGKSFVILALQNEYALLGNGKTRRVERPKKKKLKHCAYLGKAREDMAEKIRNGEKVTNHELRKLLAEFNAGSSENEEVC